MCIPELFFFFVFFLILFSFAIRTCGTENLFCFSLIEKNESYFILIKYGLLSAEPTWNGKFRLHRIQFRLQLSGCITDGPMKYQLISNDVWPILQISSSDIYFETVGIAWLTVIRTHRVPLPRNTSNISFSLILLTLYSKTICNMYCNKTRHDYILWI